jgi:hypothetical protein
LDVTLVQNVVPSVSFSILGVKKAKSHGAKYGEQRGWGMITMLLVTNSVIFRDVWEGVLS